MNSRPFVTQVFPMGVAVGQPVQLQPVGFSLADHSRCPFLR